MLNKYGFRICSDRKIKRVMEMIEKRVYGEEHIYKEEIMLSFFNLINTKTKLLEQIRTAKQMELMYYLFDQQNDNLIELCDLMNDTSDDSIFYHPKTIMIKTMNLNTYNDRIKLGNRIISDVMCLMKNYDNKMSRHPRCHHYKNKIHTQLFTELGDILICKECVGTIEAWRTYVNDCDYIINIKNTRMRELRTPPF